MRRQLEGCVRLIALLEQEGRLASPWARIPDDLIEGPFVERG